VVYRGVIKIIRAVAIILGVVVLSGIPTLHCLSQSQQEPVLALCDSGYVLLNLEEYEQARSVFREALAIDRNNVKALLGIGRAMLGPPQRANRALDYLRRVLVQTPDNLDAHYYKASAHAHLARSGFISRENGRDALDEIEIVLSINPSHADAYYLKGQVLRDVYQDYEMAITT